METYTGLLPWRLGLGARPLDGKPSNESKTSSSVVELGDGLLFAEHWAPLVAVLVVKSVTSKQNSLGFGSGTKYLTKSSEKLMLVNPVVFIYGRERVAPFCLFRGKACTHEKRNTEKPLTS